MKLRLGLVCSLVLAAVSMAGSRAHGAPQSVRFDVEARYFADSRNGENGLIHGSFPLERSIHPFRPIASRLMKYAGLRLPRGGDSDLDTDATLHIEAQGVALGSLYDFMENRMRLRHLRFTGAAVEGRVSLASRSAGMTCAAPFAGTIETLKGALIVGGWDYRESPHLAPFVKALTEPGSFVAALTAIIGAVYGPAPLRAASGDPDAAIARHARLALDRLEGGAAADGVTTPYECVTP